MGILFEGWRRKCYCGFCRSERRVNFKRHLTLGDSVWAAVAAGVVMALLFQSFDPRAMVLFVFFLMVGEIFVQVRWRVGMVCPHCGFDPVLYVRKPEKAAEKVKAHLERRKQDPEFLLAKPLDLPKVTPKKTPQRLSRRV